MDELDLLNSLLEGKTPEQPATPPENSDAAATATEDAAAGGDPNLGTEDKPADPPVDKPAEDKPADPDTANQDQVKKDAAFARMRIENQQNNKILNDIAKALGIDEKDPILRAQKLQDLAVTKLAKEAAVPVELYKELNSTKEQLATVTQQQNEITARDKFFQLQKDYSLTQDELVKFAQALDAQGVSVVDDPNTDLDYYYYKLNRTSIEKKRIDAAVEEALRKSNTADTKSSTPNTQTSKQTGEPAKVNDIASLNAFLEGK